MSIEKMIKNLVDDTKLDLEVSDMNLLLHHCLKILLATQELVDWIKALKNKKPNNEEGDS